MKTRTDSSRPVSTRTFLYFLGVFLPLLAAIAATAVLSYRFQYKAEAKLIEKNEKLLVDFESTLISNQLNSAIEDIKYLAGPSDERSSTPTDFALWMTEDASPYTAFLLRKTNYSGLRVFDSEGTNIISLTYESGEVSRIDSEYGPSAQYMLQRALSLAPGSIFVSRMSLSRRRNPIIRLTAPIHSTDKPQYYLELTYDGRTLINTIKNASSMSVGESMLLNSIGYWLLSPQKEDEWGFMSPERIGRTFAADEPEVWGDMMQNDEGVIRSDSGLFVHRTVYPIMDPHYKQKASSWNLIFDPGPYAIYAGENTNTEAANDDFHWYLVSYIPVSRIRSELDSFRSRLEFVTFVVALIIFGVSLLLTANRHRRFSAEAKLAEEAAIFMKNPAPVIRVDDHGEVIKLNVTASRLLGSSVTGARRRDLLEAFDPADVLKRGGDEPFQFEHEISGRSFLFSVERDHAERSFLLYGSDITTIRDIEGEMRKLSTAVEQSATAILISDLEGRITFANEACTRSSGYTTDELVGMSTRIFKSGRQEPELYEDLWQTIIRGEVWHGELENRTKGGEFYWEEVSITPLRTDSGRISGYLAVKEDITQKKVIEGELRNAKEQAEAANRMKSEFLANMSHEIRTPMNAILGFTDVLLDSEADPGKTKNLKIVKQSGKHLLALISDILDFSKIEAGKVEIESSTFAVRRVIDHIRSVLHESVTEKGLSFDVFVDDSVPSVVSGDEHRMTQILINVLSNAVKFTEAGGITISCSYAGGELDLRVTDTGIGIEEDKLETIFSAFEQANASTERVYGGTGLGLAITRRLVELMSGTVAATSRHGAGSIFIIQLPLPESDVDSVALAEEVVGTPESGDMVGGWFAAMGDDELLHGVLRRGIRDLPVKLSKLEEALASGDTSKLLLVAHDLKGYSGNLGMTEVYDVARSIHDGLRHDRLAIGEVEALIARFATLVDLIPENHFSDGTSIDAKIPLRILTAEDNEANRELFRVLLDRAGADSVFVGNGKEVLEHLEAGSFDVLLLDMQMPVMDGLETIRRIRADQRYDELHVIAVTAHAMEGDEERYLSVGCNDYLSKPIERKLFAEKLKRFSERSGKRSL